MGKYNDSIETPVLVRPKRVSKRRGEALIQAETAEQQAVADQKQWLYDWYSKRLPVLGKEDLMPLVDKGLSTPHGTIFRNYFMDHPRTRPSGWFLGRYYYDGFVELNDHARFRSTTPVHEFNHAIQYNGGNEYNTHLLTGGEEVDENRMPYWKQPSEQHSRIMELRYLHKLDPTKTDYTIEDLEKFKCNKQYYELRRGGMSDEDIVNALNTWASNKDDAFQVKEGVYYAKNGQKFRGLINYLQHFE